jgi:hypothetical protein
MTAYLTVSRLFLAQDGVGAERLLLDNISNACARFLEATVLGAAAGSSSQPAGMAYFISAAGSGIVVPEVPTNAIMIELESRVDGTNALAGNLAYLTSGKGRGILKSLDKGLTSDTGQYLCDENNKVNGYPLYVTNSATDACGTGASGTLVVFGNWADLVIAQWGGYDITVDPYSAAKTNQVIIVINAFVDAKCLRGTTGATVHKDDYAYSFARAPIKLA